MNVLQETNSSAPMEQVWGILSDPHGWPEWWGDWDGIGPVATPLRLDRQVTVLSSRLARNEQHGGDVTRTVPLQLTVILFEEGSRLYLCLLYTSPSPRD